VFLDDNLSPYDDQWAFLSEIRRISRSKAEELVSKAEAKGRVIGVRLHLSGEEDDVPPWVAIESHRRERPIAGPMPKELELVLGNEIFIDKPLLPPALRNRLIRLAAFQNPEFYRAQAMRLPTYETSRIVGCARDYPHHLGLPRGCLEDLRQLFSDLKITCVLRDERFSGKALNVSFQGALRPEQRVVAETMLAHETGVLAATTAFGKTVIGAWLIARRAVNTLVLVHRRQLQEQWIERLSTFLGLPADAIGRVGGGRRRPTGILDVATIQSLIHKGAVDEIVGRRPFSGTLFRDDPFPGRTEFPLMSIACTLAPTRDRASHRWMPSKASSNEAQGASLALGKIPSVPEKPPSPKSPRAESSGRNYACPRNRRARRDHRFRQDRDWRMAHCKTGRQYAGVSASAPIARTMD
jgi:hypothetical protein